MTGAVFTGLAAGLSTIAISELLLRTSGSGPVVGFLKISLIGSATRTLWVLSILIAAMAFGGDGRMGFAAGLLAGYFAGQVFEGVRYHRHFETK
jgi:hypothetical protein